MSTTILRALVVVVAAMVLLCGATRADIVHLKNGGRLEGEIVKESETALEVKTRFGVQRLRKVDVARIERVDAPATVIDKKLAALAPDDAEGRFRLAREAQENGLRKMHRELLLAVVEIDPDHAGANEELGRVRYRGHYVTPEERDRLEREARTAEMLARGLVEYNGRYVTPEEKEKLEQGLELRDGEWITRAEAMALDGYVQVGGRWVRGEDHAADAALAEAERVVGRKMVLAKTDHIAVYTDIQGEFAEKLVKLLEKGFLNFTREFQTGQSLDWLGGNRVDVFAFRLRFGYEKYVDFLGAEKGMGQDWADRARRVISIYRFAESPLTATFMANKGEAFTAAHCANSLGHVLVNRYRHTAGAIPPFFDEAYGALMEFDLLGRNVVYSLGSGRYERSLRETDHKFFEDGRWTDALRDSMRGLYDTPLDQAVRRDHGELLQMDVAKGMALHMRWRTLGDDRIRVFYDALRDAFPAGSLPPGHAHVLQALIKAFHAVEEKDIPVVDRELRTFVMTKLK